MNYLEGPTLSFVFSQELIKNESLQAENFSTVLTMLLLSRRMYYMEINLIALFLLLVVFIQAVVRGQEGDYNKTRNFLHKYVCK